MSKYMLALVAAVSLVCCSCTPPRQEEKILPGFVPANIFANVKFKGFWEDDSTLEVTNQNLFDVRLRLVNRSRSHGLGEETKEMILLKVGESKTIPCDYMMAVYIHTASSGGIIGFARRGAYGAE